MKLFHNHSYEWCNLNEKCKEMKRNIVLLAMLFFSNYLSAQQILTLEECRNLAIQNNKELQISEQKIKVAGQERKAAATKYFPQVSALGTYLHNQKNINLVDFGQFGPVGELIPSEIKNFTELDIHHVWVGNVSLVQPVFMGGKIIAYNQLTKYAKDLAKTMNDTRLQNIIYTTDETYWQVVSLVNKKKLADMYVELLRKMDSDVQIMIAEGVATQADGLSVKVKLNEAEVAQTKVDNGLSLVRMLLAQICGLSLDGDFKLTDENLENLPMNDRALPVGDLNEAFLNRPELKTLDYAVKIFKKKESIALSETLPNIAFTANYFVTNPHVFNGFKNEFSGMWNLGFVVKVPLSGWAEGTFKRNSARAETRIKQLEWESTKEKIELQVNQSVYKVSEAGKQLEASKRNMENAEENLRHASYGFEEGVIPALNLMAAQTAWMSAHSGLIDAQIELKLTEVYLDKSMGTLFVPEQK